MWESQSTEKKKERVTDRDCLEQSASCGNSPCAWGQAVVSDIEATQKSKNDTIKHCIYL